jgi:hypothetical protein
LVEFAYNNGYHTSLKINSFEVIYGRKCQTSVSWDSPADRIILGPDMLKERETIVQKAKQNLKSAQDKQILSFADLKRTHAEFNIGDHVYFKFRPTNNALKLGKSTKLAPWYCGPFRVLVRVGSVAYQLALLACNVPQFTNI